jgi:hypothetical protein
MQKVIHPGLQLPNHMNKEDHLTQGFSLYCKYPMTKTFIISYMYEIIRNQFIIDFSYCFKTLPLKIIDDILKL